MRDEEVLLSNLIPYSSNHYSAYKTFVLYSFYSLYSLYSTKSLIHTSQPEEDEAKKDEEEIHEL